MKKIIVGFSITSIILVLVGLFAFIFFPSSGFGNNTYQVSTVLNTIIVQFYIWFLPESSTGIVSESRLLFFLLLVVMLLFLICLTVLSFVSKKYKNLWFNLLWFAICVVTFFGIAAFVFNDTSDSWSSTISFSHLINNLTSANPYSLLIFLIVLTIILAGIVIMILNGVLDVIFLSIEISHNKKRILNAKKSEYDLSFETSANELHALKHVANIDNDVISVNDLTIEQGIKDTSTLHDYDLKTTQSQKRDTLIPAPRLVYVNNDNSYHRSDISGNENMNQLTKNDVDKIRTIVREEITQALSSLGLQNKASVINGNNSEKIDDLQISKKIIRVPFVKRMLSADDSMKKNYLDLKNEVMSYGVKSRVSNSGDTFRLHTKTYLKLTIAGKSLKLYFALNPKDYENTKLPITDAAHKGIYKEIPLVFKVKSELSVRRAKQLIADVMEKGNLEQGKVDNVDWIKELSNYEND
ncbi:MAG: hypothetical protein WC366_02760 [Bacilli bacterium]|jgi:hypothetical protein